MLLSDKKKRFNPSFSTAVVSFLVAAAVVVVAVVTAVAAVASVTGVAAVTVVLVADGY